MTADIFRYRCQLTGWSGAPGLTTFHARMPVGHTSADVQEFATNVRAVWNALAPYFIGVLSMNISPDVEVIRDTDGVLQRVEAITPPPTVVGSGTPASLSRATMLVARLGTDQIVNGRRLKGRHFLGPIAGSAIAGDGSITAEARTGLVNAYNGILDVLSARLVVWHRPSAAGASDGDSGFVQTVSAMPLPGVLRARRD